jgi:O-antigen/teichoic acid export membrane protein
MVTARKFLLNLTFLSGGELVAKLLTFLAVARMARALGTGLFGDVAFAVAFTLYFDLIVSQGLDVYAIQQVARDRALLRERAESILGLRLISSIVAFGALALVVWNIAKPPQVKMLLYLYGLTFLPSALSLKWVFQAVEQMKFVALANVLGQFVYSVLILIFIQNPSRLLWVPVFQFLGDMAGAAYFLILYRKNYGPVRMTFQFRAWSGMLRESIPMGLSTALSLVMFNFDMVLLGFLKPDSDVGQYGAAYKIIGFLSSLIVLYSRNLFPPVSRSKGKPSALLRISAMTQKYVLFLAVPLAVGGTMLSAPLMRVIFGPEYLAGGVALAILIWIIPVASSRVLYRTTLLSHGMQNRNLGITLVAVAVNIGLNLALIPGYSYKGSAVASLVSELLLLVLMHNFVSRRVAKIPFWNHVWKPVLICVPMAIFLAALPSWPALVRIGGGFVIYMFFGLTFGFLNAREIREIIGL